MVFRQKGGPATKRNFTPVNQKGPKKQVFDVEEDEDDDDDSDVDDNDSDDASDSGDNLNAKGKHPSILKTPTQTFSSAKKNQYGGTPFQKSGRQDTPKPKGFSMKPKVMEADSDLESDSDISDSGKPVGKAVKGKATPNQGKNVSLNKTPKGKAQAITPASGKKNQMATTPLQKGNQNKMQEFKGMKSAEQAMGKKEEDEEDDDDEDDDSDDDDEDDDDDSDEPQSALQSAGKKVSNGKKDMHVSFELDTKGGAAAQKLQKGKASAVAKGTPAKQTPKGKKNAEEEEEEEDDDDDDDDDLDSEDDISDDEDDDDDEGDDDEDDKEAIKKKVASLKKEMMPRAEKKSKAGSPTKQNTVEPKAKKEISKEHKQSLEMEQERKQERDARNLFIRNLPTDVTVDEIKALSNDILNVNIPRGKHQTKTKKALFAFIEFASEKKAEENYVKLQKKKLRGQEIFLDYSGVKSTNKAIAATKLDDRNINRKKLFVTALPSDVSMIEVAELFPQSCSLFLNSSPEYRNATAIFPTEEVASETFRANENAKVRGKTVTVMFAIEKKNREKPNNKRPFPGKNQNFSPGRNQNFSSNKRFKRDM